MKLRTCAFFSALVLFMSFSAEAQKPAAILRAGVNLANVSTQADGRFDDANQLTSFQVGILADIRLASVVYLQPGILFTGKGSKVENGDPDGPTFYRATSNPYYIELPLTLVLKTPTKNSKTRFFAGAGPYLAFGIAGKNKVDGKLLGTSFHSEENIEFSDDDPFTTDYEEGAGFGIMKRIDYGFNGTLGFEFKNIVFSGNFGYGLAKLQSGEDSSDDDFNKHRVISFTLGLKL